MSREIWKVKNSCRFMNLQIKSLKGCPEFIDGSFVLRALKGITSLEFGPQNVGRHYAIDSLPIKNLKGAPDSLEGGSLRVSYCRDLINLDGSPKHIAGGFSVYMCGLDSLVGGPKIVDEDYEVQMCDLKSTKGAPEKVGGNFKLDLDSGSFTLTDFPKSVGGWVTLVNGESEQVTEEYIRSICKVGGGVILD